MYKNVKNRLFTLLLMMTVVMTSAVPAFGASGTHITFSGQMAGTKGKMAYYSVGYCGGPLYSYNSATRKSRKIASGHWLWINVKGKYLYLTRDKIGYEDGSDMYIYRMKKNGKNRKKLAAGKCPVVKGKYIYYIGVKKYKEGKYTEDTGGTTGIYRMKLNGKGKKRLVKAGKYDTISNLGVTSRGLVYKKNDTWYKCSLKGKNRKKSDLLEMTSNMNVKIDPLSRDYSTEFAVYISGYAYFPVTTRHKIVRSSMKDGGDVFTYPGDPQKILISGKHMMVISESTDWETVYAYMMTPAGSRKKRVVKAPSMGGMWDY